MQKQQFRPKPEVSTHHTTDSALLVELTDRHKRELEKQLAFASR